MKKITRWSPDSCGCVVEYEWDTDTSENDRMHTYRASINTCSFHTAHHGKKQHLVVLDQETQLKSKVLDYAAEIAGVNLSIDEDKIRGEIMADTTLNDREKVIKVFTTIEALKRDANDFIDKYKWSFDAERNLKVSHPRLDVNHKKLLQAKTDELHGKGKVKV